VIEQNLAIGFWIEDRLIDCHASLAEDISDVLGTALWESIFSRRLTQQAAPAG
jgi:hypothetical protein